MDEQNNNNSSNTSTDANQQTNATISSEPLSATNPAVVERSKNRKWFYITISLLIILGLGAGAWAYENSKDDTPIPTVSNPTATQPSEKNLQPTSLVYSFSKSVDDPAAFYTRPLKGGERKLAETLKTKDSVTQSDVHKNQVLVVTTGGFGSDNKVAIWYSEDAGKTYEKVFSEVPTNASETGMGPQITSARFSTDGSAIVLALLEEAGGQNTVKEISLQTKIEKDLFTSEKAGVFIEAYDRDKKQLFYYMGCYNCDGNAYNKLYSRDLSQNTESAVYETTARYGVQTVLNKDQAKALVVSGVSGESLGASPPYTIEELDIATKKFRTIATVDKETAPRIGYSTEGIPYYSDGNKVYSANTGEPSVIFEDDQPIYAVYLVSKDMIVVSSGSYDTFKLTNYSLRAKEATIVLNGDAQTRIFGVAWN